MEKRTQITESHEIIEEGSEIRAQITDVSRSVTTDNSGDVGGELVLYSGQLQVGCHL